MIPEEKPNEHLEVNRLHSSSDALLRDQNATGEDLYCLLKLDSKLSMGSALKMGPSLDLHLRDAKLQVLTERRETRELSPYDFDLNFIFQLNEAGVPLTRRDLAHETGNQAAVFTSDDLRTLGYLDFIHVSGERMVIEPESIKESDVLILYPEDVGDEE